MTNTYLELSWGLSRGRETFGYNIARLVDTSTGERLRCMGGGYDMQGTVFAEWLEKHYQLELRAIADAAHGSYVDGVRQPNNDAGHYGMTTYYTPKMTSANVRLDGACGLESIRAIARALGLRLQSTVNRKGNLTGMVVTDGARS